jgi:ribonuclease HI
MDQSLEWVVASASFLYRLGGTSFEFSLPIDATSTNNQAEYEVVLKGIRLLREIKADALKYLGIPCLFSIN